MARLVGLTQAGHARFKAHVGVDADTALVEEVAITPASVNDRRTGTEALPDDPGEVFADGVYRGDHSAMGTRQEWHALRRLYRHVGR